LGHTVLGKRRGKAVAREFRDWLKMVGGLGALEVGDAVAEEIFFEDFDGGDDLGGDEDGSLAGNVGDGEFDQRTFVISLFAFEAQAATGHVFTLDDVVSALGVADEGGVVDAGARILTALDAGSVRLARGREGQNDAARLFVNGGLRLGWRLERRLHWRVHRGSIGRARGRRSGE